MGARDSWTGVFRTRAQRESPALGERMRQTATPVVVLQAREESCSKGEVTQDRTREGFPSFAVALAVMSSPSGSPNSFLLIENSNTPGNDDSFPGKLAAATIARKIILVFHELLTNNFIYSHLKFKENGYNVVKV